MFIYITYCINIIIENIKNKFQLFHNNYLYNKKNKNKINDLCFHILGVGTGHITQAKVLYDIYLQNGYKIPYIIYACKDKKNIKNIENLFKNSLVIHKYMNITEKDINNYNLNIKTAIKVIYYYFKYYNILKYKADLYISFGTHVPYIIYNKQIIITNVILINGWKEKLYSNISKIISTNKIYSILFKNNLTNLTLPSLINMNKINRDNIDKKMCIAYSVSGFTFFNTLIEIAKNNKKYTFYYFTNYITNNNNNIDIPENIILMKKDLFTFKEYLSKTTCVLCTTGNELIQECVYNKIPNASIYCDINQNEQYNNYKLYVKKYKWSIEMNNNLIIDDLIINNSIINSYNEFIELNKNAKQRILDIIN